MQIPEPPSPRKNNISRKEFVAASSSFLDAIKLNLKWLLIRQNRPFNTDDLSAFVSWFVWSNILWFALGTTTFVSLVLYTFQTVSRDRDENTILDDLILKTIFRYDSSKIHLKFNKLKDGKDNIIPDFRKGVISLRDLRVTNVNDDNCVKFDLKFDKLDITLNFNKWYQNKGLVNDVDINGISGSLDNRLYDNDLNPNDKNYLLQMIIPTIFNDNDDYEFNNIKLQNVHINYSSFNLVHPIQFDIFNLELPRLRMNWFLLDILKPKICSGSIDNSLFTIHQKQLNFNPQSPAIVDNHKHLIDLSNLKEASDEANNGNTMTRIQVHEIDLKTSSLLANKFNWLVDGKVNLICDINLPNEKHFNINDFIHEIKSKVNNDLLVGLDLDKNIKYINNFTRNITNDYANFEGFFKYSNLFHDENESASGGIGAIKKFFTFFDPSKENNDTVSSQESPSRKFGIFDSHDNTSKLDTSCHKQDNANKSKYVFFDFKVQFINAIGKIPDEVPHSSIDGTPYIVAADLRPIIALVNSNAARNSFFAKHQTSSILSPSEVTTLEHVSQPSMVSTNDFSIVQDKQFTLTGSMIYNLDEMYNKVSITSETSIVDGIVRELYDDMVRNMHYELNSNFIKNYGNNYYNFNVSHLINALGKNVSFGDEENEDRLFGIAKHRPNYKISLLILLGLGALF
ncbi:Mdm32 protein [Saccharomycopsis crataegensis]|uniref:Mdm32 protein n=1 Tax=Saccharomycopsis crataegensis TaxID=43959 RepID=A0AAV5QM34_9ASCO|nr:Mdm32 protein [Saccharomycopsis crataegensis]